MKTFKQFLIELRDGEIALRSRIGLFEHQLYKRIPGSRSSYREDPGNSNTMTIKHSHVYGRPNGKGAQLYAVNWDGSGHDGSSGRLIPNAHADYFRSRGYAIPDTNILECFDIDALEGDQCTLLVLEE